MTDSIMKRLAMSALAVAAFSSAALAQRHHPVAHPFAGVTPIGQAVLLTFPHSDNPGALTVPLAVDVQDVTVENRPAVLGAYVVKITFDPKLVRFIGAQADDDPYFSSGPYFTEAGKANAQGWVRITAVQVNAEQPIGMVRVARAQFQELVAGGSSSVKAELESASSALVRDSKGTFIRTLHIDVKDNEEPVP